MNTVLTDPITPVTAFADLMDALTRMTALEESMQVDPDGTSWSDALAHFDKQVDRAIAAHSWLVQHGDALRDITDLLDFIYDGGAP
ncbi:MAG: hypothetical protein AAFN63_11350 [Pseudomonadota bacterium]